MLLALKDKALSAGVLSNPVKITSLLDAAGKNVDTDFKVNEIRRLYDLSKDVKNEGIKSIGLADDNVSLVQTFTAVNGTSAVRPVAGDGNFAQIKAFIKKMTSNDTVTKEGATAVVLNGSSTSGLAQKHANQLGDDKGIMVKTVGNASARTTTVIVALHGDKMPATKAYLEKKYGVTSTTDTTANPEAKNYDADFVIILGSNEAPTN
jgi:hypothetical protein